MISVTILVKNGERLLDQVLDSLKNFDEIILADSGSTDNTLTIAKKYGNVKVHLVDFQGFGKTHNLVATFAKHDFILSIDADEVMSPALQNEILNLDLDPKAVYSLPRTNFFNGKEINFCGWQKERCFRLYHRKSTSFSEVMVHEGLMTEKLKKVFLKNPLLHTPYATISDFLHKMELYSTLFAKENVGKKRSSPLIAFYHGLGAFFRSYFLKRGFCGGYEGYLISIYNAQTAFYKYLKLYHANHLKKSN